MVIENNINLSYSDSLIVKQSGFDLKFYFISSSSTSSSSCAITSHWEKLPFSDKVWFQKARSCRTWSLPH